MTRFEEVAYMVDNANKTGAYYIPKDMVMDLPYTADSYGFYQCGTMYGYKMFRIYSPNIMDWIDSHPKHMYRKVTDYGNYIFSDEMEAWFKLRWS